MSALLVSEEISVNLKTPEGWTALVAAADKGHHDLVKTLLRNKAVDVNVRDNQSELYNIAQCHSTASCFPPTGIVFQYIVLGTLAGDFQLRNLKMFKGIKMC